MSDAYRDLRRITFAGERSAEPVLLGRVLSELVALKGLARVQGSEQLQQAWQTVVGEEIGQGSRVLELSRGVLNVGVSNSALLNEVVGFHKQVLLEKLQTQFAHLKIREIRFRLKAELK